MRKVTDSTFDKEVLEAGSAVLVDFYTDMCQPCKNMAPILDKMNEELEDVEIVKFDAYEGNIPEKYQITSVPTLILFNDGKEVARREGSAPGAVIELWIELSLD
jgi:thioredoxin 1